MINTIIIRLNRTVLKVDQLFALPFTDTSKETK